MTSEKIESDKASCKVAPFGEKRAKAWEHYYAADAAHRASNHMKNQELEAATNALAQVLRVLRTQKWGV